MPCKIWAVGAGKGGVGKTFVSSSLGITLAKLNFSVLVVDFDISCANMHTTLGLEPEALSLKHFLTGEKKLEELVRKTTIPHLDTIQGLWDQWASIEVTRDNATALMEEARKLSYDFVVIDLAPGASSVNLEIFSKADERILISTPEPTAVEKSYRFVEAFIWDFLSRGADSEQKPKILKALGEYRAIKKQGHLSFKSFLQESTGIPTSLVEALNMQPMRLIINESRSRLDLDLGHSMKSVCTKYFDLVVEYMGAIDYDNAVWQSVRNREPFLVEKPFTPLSGQFLTMCKSLTTPDLHAQIFRAVV